MTSAIPSSSTDHAMSQTFQLSAAEVAAFWSTDDLPLTRQQSELLPEIQKWLNRRKSDPLADYLTGKPATHIKIDATQTLARDIIARFRPQTRGLAAIQLFAKLIDRANASGMFVLCPPPNATLIRRRASPFAEDRWKTRGVASRLRELLAHVILNPGQIVRGKVPRRQLAEIVVGELLLSAIVHGGLIDASLLDALVRRLAADGPAIACLDRRLFIDLSLNWRSQADAEFRRWYLDALTAILAMKLEREAIAHVADAMAASPRSSNRVLWKCIRAFLKHSHAKSHDFPGTLRKLLDAVRLDLETRLPIVLANYAAREIICHSLKPDVWQRLHGPTDAPTRPLLDEPVSRTARPPAEDLVAQGLPEPRWLKDIRAALADKSPPLVAANLRKLLEEKSAGFETDSPGALLTGFAHHLATAHNEYGARNSLATIRGYAVSAARRIGGLLGCDNLERRDPDEWACLYEEVLGEEENKGARRRLARMLRAFHRYLEIEHHAEPIDKAEVFGADSGLVPVDANIIANDEFLRIREHFSSEVALELDADVAECAWLILTLAYRCGLRRMEALKLDLEDAMIETPAELLVRPTEGRRLKTKSSTRKIPLHALLDPEELARLAAWVRRRRQEEAVSRYSRFLFAAPRSGFVFVPQDTLFPLLHRVMREVTGDPGLRFHHLRHSFATLRCLSLLSRSIPDERRFLRGYPFFSHNINERVSLRESLFGNAGMTRRDVWAVSALLGHSGPDVSLEHYIHSLDVCLAEHLDVKAIRPSIAVITQAARHSAVHTYRLLDEGTDDLHPLLVHLWRQHGGGQATSPGASPSTPVTVRVNDHRQGQEAEVSLSRIWRLLLLEQLGRIKAGEVGERSGIDPEEFAKILARARCLGALSVSSKQGKFRHRFKSVLLDKRDTASEIRICCPIKPHKAHDLSIVRILAPQLDAACVSHQALAERVLRHYALEAPPEFAGMIFKDPEQSERAKDFLAWLSLLGLSGKNIRFVCYDVTTQRSPYSAQWKRALGLRSDHPIDKRAPINGRKDWACPWIGIEPVWMSGAGKASGSPAFRFLMVMRILMTRSIDDLVTQAELQSS